MSTVRLLRPFHEVSGGSSSSRRLLLISPVFPPSQGVGALRWQKMAPYFWERGWEIDVITLDPRFVDAPDWSRLADLPPGTRLFGAPAPVVPLARMMQAGAEVVRTLRPGWTTSRRLSRPAGERTHEAMEPRSVARRKIRWTPGNPRAYIRAFNAWLAYEELKRAARDLSMLGDALIRANHHAAIISSGPPHSAHEAARRIARSTGVPFIMDMRDPWALFHRCSEDIASPLLLRLGRRYERRAVEQAALVVANTAPAREAMTRQYPHAAARLLAVTNGFDEDPRPPTKQGSRFTLAHAGTIYLDRSPSSVLHAVRQVIDELHLTPSQFVVEFIGADHGDVPVASIAEAEGIDAYVRSDGLRSRAEALELLARASILVVLPQDSATAIPAKVFEYMRFDAWLLALADRHSATERVLRETGADVASGDDIAAIAAIIRERYRQYAAGVRPRAIAAAAPHLSRRTQAGLLLEALDRLLDERSSSNASAPGSMLLEGAPT